SRAFPRTRQKTLVILQLCRDPPHREHVRIHVVAQLIPAAAAWSISLDTLAPDRYMVSDWLLDAAKDGTVYPRSFADILPLKVNDRLLTMHRARAHADVFRAIADPTRRAILDRLRAGPTPVNALADDFRQSRPAISKHLRVLRQARLVSEKRVGRERR